MKYLFLFLALTGISRAQDALVENASPAVVASAVEAVNALGKEVVLGRYRVAVDRMYPQWKEREAARAGGMDKLEAKLEEVPKQMLNRGISVTNFTSAGQARAYEVSPGKTVTTVNGQQVERLRYTKWMVLVPTVTNFRLLVEGNPKPVIIQDTGFQVAISDKGANKWSFIDGSSLTINDLRKLFRKFTSGSATSCFGTEANQVRIRRMAKAKKSDKKVESERQLYKKLRELWDRAQSEFCEVRGLRFTGVGFMRRRTSQRERRSSSMSGKSSIRMRALSGEWSSMSVL